MGGDPFSFDLPNANRMFQSTPPHGGRPHIIFISCTALAVSIHAPAWGATSALRVQGRFPVSIHAPAWGATRSCLPKMASGSFQSTPPHGGRPINNLPSVDPGTRFNPRPRMGGDQHKYPLARGTSSFNPRPRMGGDPYQTLWEEDPKIVSIHAPAWGATKV